MSVSNGLPSVESAFIIPGIFDIVDKYPKAQRVFPHLMQALNAIAMVYQSGWKGYASGVPIPGVPRVINSRGPYINSIKVDLSEKFRKRVYTNFKYEGVIEEGHGEIDLKQGLLQGAKARLGKNGAFNVVSFQHGTPKSNSSPMPTNVYNWIQKEFKKATIQQKETLSSIQQKRGGTLVTHPQTGMTRQLDKYRWGASTGRTPFSNAQAMQKLTSVGNYKWKTSKFSGMYKFNTGTSKAKRSNYRTFRTVSIKSDPASWRVPPIEGIPIRYIVLKTYQKEAMQIMRAAIDMDLEVKS